MEAEARHRVQLGSPIIFKLPVAPTWPGGTKINPITNLPYDPTIVRTSVAFTEVTKTCLIILKQGSPLRPQADTKVTARGEESEMDMIIDMAESDYQEVKLATEMVVNGLNYQIKERKPFAIGGIIYRSLVYGQET